MLCQTPSELVPKTVIQHLEPHNALASVLQNKFLQPYSNLDFFISLTDSSKIPSFSIDDNLTNVDTATSVYVNALANGGEIVHYSTDNTFLSNLQA